MLGEQQRRQAVELSLIDSAGESFHVGWVLCRVPPPGAVRRALHLFVREDGGRTTHTQLARASHCACGFSNRIRAAIQIVQQEIRPERAARIYLTERVTGLYQWLQSRYPSLVGSEYLGDRVPLGTEHEGIRNEDLTALTFTEGSFDLILSFDVMEHVPDSNAALRECLRCLRPGGILMFGAPFRLGSQQNLERARVLSDGTIEHLMSPEYHWQPLTSENEALCFRHFGWQVLDQMRDAGFADPRALLYWSLELGYLGGDQVLFLASRPDQEAGGLDPVAHR